MIGKIALIATAGLFAATVASAQSSPPPGNVNPGSTKSGAEQTGAPNQPRSSGGQMGTTGTGPGTAGGAMQGDMRDGTNANVKPGSMQSDAPSGAPADKPRGKE